MKLIPDQLVYAITLSKTRDQIIFMFPDSLNKVRSDSDIKGAVLFTRQDVYCGLFIHGGGSLLSYSA